MGSRRRRGNYLEPATSVWSGCTGPLASAAKSPPRGGLLAKSRGRGAGRPRPSTGPARHGAGPGSRSRPGVFAITAESDVRRDASISPLRSSAAVPTTLESDGRRIASRSSSPADLPSSCWAGPPPLRLLARPRARLPPWRAPPCRLRMGADRLGLGAGGWAGGAGPGAARAPPPTWGCQWRASAGSQGRQHPLGPTGRTPKQPWGRLTPFPALGRGWGRCRGWWEPRPRLLACRFPGAR